ncbi:uncharacterized protein F4822DRAFT_442677 [Hypoxylon trugodes]|uniref:uncharacterized protein n=1 Tax=Hypoxylon trugodes TaxID=326681 RepID=UPI00218E978D|nr:uncharacterized protein F4822DRAFT_442677 [Hypoxylon trugodes]KAI1389310.1 hypothetical protein F4822DRAFT_442677 [Hypoxylon trugodes]
MAEASAVIGIVSFGIQVCDGLRSYLSAINGRHKELNDAWEDVRILAEIFKRLNQAVIETHPQRPDDAALLLQCLRHATSCLIELRDTVAKLAKLPPDEVASPQNTGVSLPPAVGKHKNSLKEKSKAIGRAIVYKFHQEDVRNLRQKLQHLTTLLNLAVLITNPNRDRQSIESLKDSVSTFSFSLESKASDIRTAIDSLPSAVDLQTTIQENATKLDAFNQRLSSDISSIKYHLSTTEQTTTNTALQISALGDKLRETDSNLSSQNELMLARFQLLERGVTGINNIVAQQQQGPDVAKRIATEVTNRIARYLPPSSLRQACDTVFVPPIIARADTQVDVENARHPSPNIMPPGCICQCRTRTTLTSTYSHSLFNFTVFSRKQKFSHRAPNCPLHAVGQRGNSRTAGARLHFRIGSFLNNLVEVAIWCSTGAGGYSLGPSVRWKNLVSMELCPVHKEIQNVYRRIMAGSGISGAKEVAEQLESCQEKVITLYREGSASVNDIYYEDGHNHLQKYLQTLTFMSHLDLLTPDVMNAVAPMIQFYIEAGLNCKEQGWRPTAKSTSYRRIPKFLPHINNSTTLALSTEILVRFKGQATDQRAKLISSIAQISDPEVEDVIEATPYMDSRIFFTHILDHEICMDVSPLAQSIILRSLDALEYQIKFCPESVLQTTYGLTALHLSIGWPQGLARLLKTDARLLLDTTCNFELGGGWGHKICLPFGYAAANQCPQSLDILLGAGCSLWPQRNSQREELSYALESTSEACAEIFAYHMAQRRRDLLSIFLINLEKIREFVPMDLERTYDRLMENLSSNPEHKPVLTAESGHGEKMKAQPVLSRTDVKSIIICLDHAKVPVSAALRDPSNSCREVYQFEGFPLRFFPIFAKHGFSQYNAPDYYGLRPLMYTDRAPYSFWQASLGDNIQDVLPWLVEHGCLDVKPAESEEQPRVGLKLSTAVTGWHYLSLTMVINTWGWQATRAKWNVSRASQDLMVRIAEGEGKVHHDGCLCWCTNQPALNGRGGGCSPFSYLCKQYIYEESIYNLGKDNFWHHLFRHKCNGISNVTAGEQPRASTMIPIWQKEFIRLLTFEALEMTHTCCASLPLYKGYGRRGIFEYPNPEEARQIREDPSEKDKAQQLEKLIVEFTEHLERGTGSPQEFEKFIFGPWRTRIVDLYVVNMDEIEKMGSILDNIQTYELPEPLQKFFGEDFPFFDTNEDVSEEDIWSVWCWMCNSYNHY